MKRKRRKLRIGEEVLVWEATRTTSEDDKIEERAQLGEIADWKRLRKKPYRKLLRKLVLEMYQ